jgi:hypothetical protein
MIGIRNWDDGRRFTFREQKDDLAVMKKRAIRES